MQAGLPKEKCLGTSITSVNIRELQEVQNQSHLTALLGFCQARSFVTSVMSLTHCCGNIVLSIVV